MKAATILLLLFAVSANAQPKNACTEEILKLSWDEYDLYKPIHIDADGKVKRKDLKDVDDESWSTKESYIAANAAVEIPMPTSLENPTDLSTRRGLIKVFTDSNARVKFIQVQGPDLEGKWGGTLVSFKTDSGECVPYSIEDEIYEQGRIVKKPGTLEYFVGGKLVPARDVATKKAAEVTAAICGEVGCQPR
jgi:hypothetical protein